MARNNITDTDVLRVYGGAPADDITNRNVGAAEPRNQLVPEVLGVGTYGRMVYGCKKGGRFALQVFIDSAGGAASTGTVWYSNVSDPDPVTDTDWFQDATIGSIDLTVTGNKMFFGSSNMARWIRVKMVVAVSSASVRAFIRTEGTSVSGL